MEPIATASTDIKTENTQDTCEIKPPISEEKPDTTLETEKPVYQYFHCSNCSLNEKYEYFGKNPPYTKIYQLSEEAFCIEDPFVPPKQGQFIVLGAHCIKCNKTVCKDTHCSFYFGGTYCIKCAKKHAEHFPNLVKEKLNKIAVS